MKREEKTGGRVRSRWILAANAVLITAIVLIFAFFTNSYNDKLLEENLRNIRNLNQSASSIAASYFDTRRERLADIALYVSANTPTLEETLEYITESTSSRKMNSIQLVGANSVGLVAERGADGSYPEVRYTHGDYGRLQQIFTSATPGDTAIHIAPEFTNNLNAAKSFALYTYLFLSDGNGGTTPYTMMSLAKTRDIIALFNLDGGYEAMSTVLTNARGDYILSGNEFKTLNFFDYLYSYNDLSLDERNAVAKGVMASSAGELYYKDSHGRDCVFLYTRVSNSDWFCVSSVPLASFHMSNTSYRFTLLMAAVMLALFAVDVGWLTALNRRLKTSMELEQQANAAKSEFLSRMSHDIRTPLNGIIGSTMLAMDEPNPPATAAYLRAIDSSSQFLLGLVNDILDMSKVESGKMTLLPQPYHPGELREYLCAVILPLAQEKGIRFHISANDDDPALMLDRLRFNQICFNLLSNAVKFTPSGGTVEFILKQTPLDEGMALLEVTVRDNGIGMSAEFQQHMFEVFSQEARPLPETAGAGLGLAIVKNLVELMRGELSVKSAQGEGSTFYLRLKAAVCADAAPQTALSAPADLERLQGRRVLLCEDNEINLTIALRLLEKKGIEADVARDGREGVQRFLRSTPGEYSAILMDIMMPRLDGLCATREIRASHHPDAARVPILAMTANAYASDIEACLAAGMNTHVAKPVEPALLYAALAQWMR